MELEFTGEIFHWRGPAPHHFVTVPTDVCQEIQEVAARLTYGWGVIPVGVRVGDTDWTTSLFPKNGGYLVPVRADVRRAEKLELGDTVTITLMLDAD
ncbi:hypothetical protein HDA40_006083 [Hamadaea flava]|uniref:DUF1905 domain-containing protein n=1 Tax=Hamadaea flava TaxID=1742688 RepID=A0ABV8LU64_9ACTN|nr:DUF1905 domain-containing protein [Hamadaea flava]MCP2327576.1 hypothetical protein [Hamadaea flava]